MTSYESQMRERDRLKGKALEDLRKVAEKYPRDYEAQNSDAEVVIMNLLKSVGLGDVAVYWAKMDRY